MAFKVYRGSALHYTLKFHYFIVLSVSTTPSQFFLCSTSQICKTLSVMEEEDDMQQSILWSSLVE